MRFAIQSVALKKTLCLWKKLLFFLPNTSVER
jgi:hypothetical protein